MSEKEENENPEEPDDIYQLLKCLFGLQAEYDNLLMETQDINYMLDASIMKYNELLNIYENLLKQGPTKLKYVNNLLDKCGEQLICAICLEDDNLNINNTTILKCFHRFHSKCIQDYAKNIIDTRDNSDSDSSGNEDTVIMKCPNCKGINRVVVI